MPAPPLLLVNLNNTWTKVAPLHGHRIGKVERILTADLSASRVRDWKRAHPGWPLCLASVVPARNRIFETLFPPSRFHRVTHRSPLGFPIGFPRPGTVGADRLANAAAIHAHYQLPAVVLDFGTALTFDIIGPEGDYRGGVIAPGLGVFTDYLAERTALLPRLSLRAPRTVIGTSTRHAMRSGAYYGYRGLVREVLQGVQRELGKKKPLVIATGGHSRLMAPAIPEIDRVDPHLTLKGIAQIARNWQNSSSA